MLNILPASHAATGSIVVNTPAMDAAVPSRGGIVVSWANHQDEVRAAQRLRYDVFAGEMGARLTTPLPATTSTCLTTTASTCWSVTRTPSR